MRSLCLNSSDNPAKTFNFYPFYIQYTIQYRFFFCSYHNANRVSIFHESLPSMLDSAKGVSVCCPVLDSLQSRLLLTLSSCCSVRELPAYSTSNGSKEQDLSFPRKYMSSIDR